MKKTIIQLKEFQKIISKKDYEDEEHKYLPEKTFEELSILKNKKI